MAGVDPIVLYAAKDHVARICLNRPPVRHALSPALIAELREALRRAQADAEVRAVVLTAVGEDTFSVGGDLAELADPRGTLEQHETRGGFADLFRLLAGLGKPVIARVDGACFSAGLGLALACDLVVASDDSTFGTPEIGHGLVPMMTMATLIRNCGRKKALEMILGGRAIHALEAERIGLINHAVPVEELDARVDALARHLAGLSPAVMRLARDAFYTMADLEFHNALAYLQTMLTLNLSMEDAREGVAAYLEKRAPEWTGR
jgi:enoyl-CoA hydratase/carnithine racemase